MIAMIVLPSIPSRRKIRKLPNIATYLDSRDPASLAWLLRRPHPELACQIQADHHHLLTQIDAQRALRLTLTDHEGGTGAHPLLAHIPQQGRLVLNHF